jgi:hypothetical protein
MEKKEKPIETVGDLIRVLRKLSNVFDATDGVVIMERFKEKSTNG